MRIVRFSATGLATVTAAMLLFADSPALAVATWESRQVEVGAREGDGLFGVSCPTASLCVAVGNRGTIVTSGQPDGGAHGWRSETVTPGVYVGTAAGEPDRTSPGTFEAVSCPTAGMCAAVTYAGDFYATGDPAGGASTWRAADLDGDGDDVRLKSISCPTPAFCVAVAARGFGALDANGGGKIVAIRDPLSASISPVQVQLDESLDLQAVSCASLELCIAVANQGRIVISTNPGATTPGWKEIGTPGGPGDLEAVDCPDPNLCLAGNARGNVLSSIDAHTGAPRWREANTGPSVPITGISCPTVSRCAAVDNNGNVSVSTNPTGPVGSWSATNLIPFPSAGSQGLPFNAFFGVSCPSVDFCAAVGSQGMIFTSGNPFDVGADRGGEGRSGPKRPRMKILHSDNFVRQSQANGSGSRVTFRLRPYGRVRGFICSLDGRRFHRCGSPLRIYAKVGLHILRARAIGMTGLKGPVAKDRFSIRGRGR
ncbi:MAG TPA: hypothetical protein VFI03_09195 [Solirubrobacterales bacterium]|nr:hypothetical protein [Solirubrobacterales bacterium]